MMSLFSSFDYLFFYWSSIFFLFLLFSSSFLIFFSSSFKFSLSFVHSNLNLFFSSLKFKGMNKFSMLLFFSIFIFLFVSNLYSVFSFNFASTSQISNVFSISLGIWCSFIFYSTFFSFKKMISHYIPEGSPLMLTPFLFLIELVSSIIRPLTLMVRLSANIIAGHLLMNLLSKLVFHFSAFFILYILLNLVELFVSLIQAYIFSTMLVLYFSEN